MLVGRLLDIQDAFWMRWMLVGRLLDIEDAF
jgi:hypothetical protein